MTSLNRQQDNARRWTLLCWTAIFALVCARQLQQGINVVAAAWALAFSLPLLLCLRGLMIGNRYTYKWATLCVLPYFIIGITEGVANVSLRKWALMMLAASLLWFFALLAFLRVSSAAQLEQQS
jgi:uncharacterized membrane protein